MKQLIIIVLALITSSCCNAKKVVQDSPNQTTSKTIEEATKVISDSITKTVDSIKNTSKTETFDENKNNNKEESKIPLPPKPPKQDSTSTFNHNKWNKLLQQFVTKNGNVDYTSIRKNRTDLDIYIDILSHNLPNDDWSKQKKLAYWINAYNAFTIDLIIRNYPIKTIKDIKDPWKQRLWKLGDKWYNLDEIEHQILRKMDEPRIHFAIVCASYSCPKLQNTAFTSDNLETQLTNATIAFLNDTKRNEITENKLKLSKIFKWFSKDFKQNGNLIDFLNQYVSITISQDAKISYKDYNWDLND